MRRRGKNFTEADRDAIRLMLQHNYSVRRMAAVMGRGKSGIADQIARMRKDGTIGQAIMDVGQCDVSE